MEHFEEIIGTIKGGEDYPEQLENISAFITDESGAPQKA
jgi:hypothetical protein